MSEPITLADFLKSLPQTTVPTSFFALVFDSAGSLNAINPINFQRSVFSLQNVDLDDPGRSGVFNISSSTGTKPCTYGIVISIGTYDIYQIAIGSDNNLYYRANTNKQPKPWIKLAKAT